MGPNRSASSVLALVAALFSALTPLHAQETAPHRGGFWLAGGLGGGLEETGEVGVGASLRMGGTLSQHLLLGGELQSFVRDATIAGEEGTVSRATLTASLFVYPSVASGVFVKGGLGFGFVEREIPVIGGTISTREDGAAGTLEVGYDLPLGDGNLYLTPTFDVMLQGFDGLETVDSVYTLGLEIGFR